MATTSRQSVTLTGPQHQTLLLEADRLGITVSDLIRRIIDQWREVRTNQPALAKTGVEA